MSHKPTLYLMCGLPGSGKTTMAKVLEREAPAIRLTPDDWMSPLYGPEIADPEHFDRWNEAHDRVEQIQWTIAERALSLGINVVLDFGVWSGEEREEFRARAAAVGARSELKFMDQTMDVLKQRVKARNESAGPGAYRISDAELEAWSAQFQPPAKEELDPRE